MLGLLEESDLAFLGTKFIANKITSRVFLNLDLNYLLRFIGEEYAPIVYTAIE